MATRAHSGEVSLTFLQYRATCMLCLPAYCIPRRTLIINFSHIIAQVLNALAEALPELVGGSADLAGSNCTNLKVLYALLNDRSGVRIRCLHPLRMRALPTRAHTCRTTAAN
jgi:hypothetical protein